MIDLVRGGPIADHPARRAHAPRDRRRTRARSGATASSRASARILRDGNGADRQLAVYAATGDPRDVARDIADVTQAG